MAHIITPETEINSFYVIISGLFRFSKEKINEPELWKHYTNWKGRIFGGEYKETFNYLNHSYYDSYLNNIFPETRFDENELDHLNPKILNHLTHRNCLGDSQVFSDLSLQLTSETSVPCGIEYIDIYLFPPEIGIFSLKINLKEKADFTIGGVSNFLNKIRHLDSVIKTHHNHKSMKIKEFLEEDVLHWLNLDENWSIYNPQLKMYTSIDLKHEIPQEEMDFLLYDIGNVALPGSARGEGIFAPSDVYLKEQLNNNKITVFKNWTALALYDTFTRISINYPDNFRSWEYDYFNLYIHSLYIKFYMYLTNSELSDVTVVSKQTEKIRDKFIEFINDYHHSHISYKFLPDLLHDKLLISLDIQSEIERMETKIQRINEHSQEKREKSFNIALIIITLLSVFSVLYDASEWIVNLGVSRQVMYPFLSITNGLIIFLLIYVIFKRGNK